MRATDTTSQRHTQSMGCTSLTCGVTLWKLIPTTAESITCCPALLMTRHTHCVHILHLSQTVPLCSTFFWLYVSDDQPYRIMHSLKFANTGTDSGTGMVANPTGAVPFHWPVSQWWGMQATKIHFLQSILNVLTNSRSLCYLNTSCISCCDRTEKNEQYSGAVHRKC